MPQYTSLVQRTFIRGLNSAADLFDQVKGSIPHVSNMLFSVRGALRTMFGGAIVSGYNGLAPVTNAEAGAIKRILLTLDIANGNIRQLFFLQDVFGDVGPVTGFTATSINTAGGTLTPGDTFTYKIAVTDSDGIDGLNPSIGHPAGIVGAAVSATVTIAPGDNAVRLSWNGQPGPTGYIITFNSGPNDKLHAFVQNPAMEQQAGFAYPAAPVINYTDISHPIGGLNLTFGANNNINHVVLRVVTASNPTYSVGNTVAKFPIGFALKAYPPIGGQTATATEQSQSFSACGGSPGLTEAVPDLIEFNNQLIALLGNGYPPHYAVLGNVPLTFPVSNNYTANYPVWNASETNLTGDNIVPTVSNGYFYTCTQAGVTGTVEPTWPTTVGQTIVDHQVIWKCAGLVTSSPAPAGAAHGIYYAGSFWVFNTSPTNTSDGIDGPSSLRMSDIDAFNSWNPVNQAFIGKDDGSEGMGLATFTIAETGIPPTGSLVLFKNFSTYQVLGVFGAPDLAIQQIQSDMGCIAPRSIQFLSGFGIVRLSHLGFALFNGVRDNLISEEIRPYLFGGNPQQLGNLPSIDWTYAYLSQGSQATNPPMYICAAPCGDSNGKIHRLFCYDLVLKAWTILDFPTDINPDLYIRSLYQIRSPGAQPITIAGAGGDGTIFRLFYGDETWPDGVTPIAWAFTTPEAFNPQSPTGRLYIRKIRLRGQYRGTANSVNNPISISIVLDGSDPFQERGSDIVLPCYSNFYQLSGTTSGFVIEADVNETCINAHALISGTGQVEIDSVEWLVEPKPTTVPPRIT